MKTLMIKDLPSTAEPGMESSDIRLLSPEELKRIRGGRAISVMVDGDPNTVGTVDDFGLNMEIFKGNIGGPMVI
jgi:hypothetical protein